MSDDPGKLIEWMKIWVDYLKHLTTLSTGSLVLIVTFLDKLFVRPRWNAVMIASLIGFLVSILGSVVLLTIISIVSYYWANDDKDQLPDYLATMLKISLPFTWLGFSTGVVCMTVFSIKNLIGAGS
jgi:hypothetical protein